MKTMNELSIFEYNLEMNFSKMCREAEEQDRRAIQRFRRWFEGLMDPEEEALYTSAVEQCAGNLRRTQ